MAMTKWGFQCTCALCTAEGADSVEVQERRSVLVKQAKELIANRDPYRSKPDIAIIKEAEKLAGEIMSTYDKQRFAGLPHLALIDIQHWISLAWATQPVEFVTKTQIATTNFLRSLAYEVHLQQGRIVKVHPTAHCLTLLRAIDPLIQAAMSNMTRNVNTTDELLAVTRIISLALNGTHHPFNAKMSEVANAMRMRRFY